MNPDDLARVLDDLTARFGPAATRLWELAVRQSVVEGVVSIVGGVLVIVIPVVIYVALLRYFMKQDKERTANRNNNYYDSFEFFPFVMGGAFLLLPIGLGGTALWNGIIWALNPEWQAIQVLARLLPA